MNYDHVPSIPNPNTNRRNNNGLVKNVDASNQGEYRLFNECTSSVPTFQREAVKTVLEANDVSTVFFSKDNIDYLQGAIIQRVYELSNGRFRIGRQSDTELQIIMRSIYLQFGKNLPTDIRSQIRELDEKVLEEAVPVVFSGVEQHMRYKDDINNMYVPNDRPSQSGIKGSRSLEYNPFL